MPSRASKDLVIIDNPSPGRSYQVDISTAEFTCLCPMTGQPDFATISISYHPAASIVELKSLKLYLWSFRQEGHYHEGVINAILDDLSSALSPEWMRVQGTFNIRGGIATTISAEYNQSNNDIREGDRQ
jgi:7-cyano-7-deazaguanine reductase